MATGAIFAQGTLFKVGDAATPTEVFTTVSEVTDIGGPGLTLNSIEATSHDSPNGWIEKIGGLLDGGEVSISINYKPTHATHNATTGLIADMKARTLRNFQIVFPDGGSTTWAFSALVTNFEPTEPIDDKLTADVTVEISGEPTLV